MLWFQGGNLFARFVNGRDNENECEKNGGAIPNFERVTMNPNQMGGVPCVRGMRIPVATVLRMLAAGMSHPEILEAYPDLEENDIRDCLRFAAASAMEREIGARLSA